MGIRISIFFVLMVSFSFSQNETEKKSNNLVFDGNIKFDNKDFEIAEYNYRIAKSIDSLNYNAPYNLGNSLYKNNLGTDAQIMYKSALKKNSSKENKHKGFHNLGNTYMQKEDYQNAVNSFKQALLNNPDDEETRYNYVLAKELLKNQNQNNKNDNKDNKDNQDKDNKSDNKKEEKDDKGGINLLLHYQVKDFEKLIKKEIQPFDDINILFISCINKQRIYKSLECAIEVFKTRSKQIKTSKLNNDLLPLIHSYPPPSNKGKRIKIKYCSQLPGRYPQFAFFANLPQYIKDPYKRFLENNIRKIYGFTSVPIKIYFRKK